MCPAIHIHQLMVRQSTGEAGSSPFYRCLHWGFMRLGPLQGDTQEGGRPSVWRQALLALRVEKAGRGWLAMLPRVWGTALGSQQVLTHFSWVILTPNSLVARPETHTGRATTPAATRSTRRPVLSSLPTSTALSAGHTGDCGPATKPCSFLFAFIKILR